MSFHQRLTAETQGEWDAFFALPFVAAAVRGELTREQYVAFLSQAYHHVKHTVPLLMAAGSRLPDRLAWLRKGIAEYIAEEVGHEEWILSDIQACGADAEAVRRSQPAPPCELMLAYAYDGIQRVDPIGFLGMIYVLEGASIRGATKAGRNLQESLGLPAEAFTYLRSHGALDEEHVDFFAGLCDQITESADQERVLHCAHRFFQLYGDVFRGFPQPARGRAGVRA